MSGEIAQVTITVATIAALPKSLQDALGMVATDQDGWASKGALRKLVQRGLVEPYEELVYGSGTAPIDRIPLRVIRYEVPLPVHIAWAEWCSTQVVDDDEVTS